MTRWQQNLPEIRWNVLIHGNRFDNIELGYILVIDMPFCHAQSGTLPLSHAQVNARAI